MMEIVQNNMLVRTAVTVGVAIGVCAGYAIVACSFVVGTAGYRLVDWAARIARKAVRHGTRKIYVKSKRMARSLRAALRRAGSTAIVVVMGTNYANA